MRPAELHTSFLSMFCLQLSYKLLVLSQEHFIHSLHLL
jgi:hypothetical protein